MLTRGRASAAPTRTTTATAKKEYAPSPAIGYNGKSKKGTEYIKVIIDLAVLGVGEGKVTLLGFDANVDSKTGQARPKKNKNAPDIRFIQSTPREDEAVSDSTPF